MAVEFKQDQDKYRYPAIILNGAHVGALVPYAEGWKELWFGDKPKINRMDELVIADKLEELEMKESLKASYMLGSEVEELEREEGG